ncbi:MAG: DUF4399 domain-containing protein [Rhodothermaceae bacterium]|nr:DUF4399 domain-containing protein [Rhodothermaceae bacterium]
MKTLSTLFLLSILSINMACAQEMPKSASPEGASVYIISPANGEVVSNPVTIKFGLKGMGIAPAGIEYPESGHHHLLINVDQLASTDTPIPSDDNHRHFGKGQTEVTLDLPEGTHTLQLVLGDQFHIPHNPPVMSEKVTVVVK